MADYSFATIQFPTGILQKEIFDIFESVVKDELTKEEVAAKITKAYEENVSKPLVIDTLGNAIDLGAVKFDLVESSIIDQFIKAEEDAKKDANSTLEFELVEQGVIDAWSKQTTMITIGGSATTPNPPPVTVYGSFIPPPGWAFISNASVSNTFTKKTIPKMPKIGKNNMQRNSFIVATRFTDLFIKHIKGTQIVYVGYLPPTPTLPFPPAPPFSSGNLSMI